MSELRLGWVLSDISAVTSHLTDGTHMPPPREESGVPLLSARDIVAGRIRPSQARFVSESYFLSELERTRLAENDVLLTIVGSIGRSAVVPAEPRFALQRSVAILKPCGVESRFLAHFLGSPEAFAFYAKRSRGTAQQGLYLRHLKDLPVPIPPLNEQRRIVAAIEEHLSRLDALEATIESIVGRFERGRGRVGALRRSILVRAFSGRLVPQDPSDEPASVLLDRIRAERSAVEPTGLRRRARR